MCTNLFFSEIIAILQIIEVTFFLRFSSITHVKKFVVRLVINNGYVSYIMFIAAFMFLLAPLSFSPVNFTHTHTQNDIYMKKVVSLCVTSIETFHYKFIIRSCY